MKKYTALAMLVALGIVFSIVESFIPTIVIGAKLGLANIVTLVALYMFGVKEASLVLILRILLVSFLLGSFLSVTFYMSISGGLLALIIMILIKKLHFHLLTVSICGSLAHGLGQIIIAMILISPSAFYYYPLMGIVGILTGIVTGLITSKYLKISGNEKKVNDLTIL